MPAPIALQESLLTRWETTLDGIDRTNIFGQYTGDGGHEMVDAVALESNELGHFDSRRDAARQQVGTDKIDNLAT